MKMVTGELILHSSLPITSECFPTFQLRNLPSWPTRSLNHPLPHVQPWYFDVVQLLWAGTVGLQHRPHFLPSGWRWQQLHAGYIHIESEKINGLDSYRKEENQSLSENGLTRIKFNSKTHPALPTYWTGYQF